VYVVYGCMDRVLVFVLLLVSLLSGVSLRSDKVQCVSLDDCGLINAGHQRGQQLSAGRNRS